MDVTVLVMDGRVWFESVSLVDYLRELQRQARLVACDAEEIMDLDRIVAAVAVEDAFGQVVDGIVLTSMSAAEEVRGRRGL